jgi:hypothetical protein
MNIFYLSNNVEECAQMHVDKHVVKMITEQCQLLSTAHRVIDGVEYIDDSSGRKIKRWKLGGSYEYLLYKATHINHPSAIWARKSFDNYMWLHSLTEELCKEYTHRYGKIHKCEYSGLLDTLSYAPFNIPVGIFTEPTCAMPDKYIVKGDSIQSYKNYYTDGKQHLFSWKNRPIPEFITL